MKEKLKKLPLLDYLFLAIGSAIMAVGIGVFLIDAKVVPGGVSGLSMAIHYLFGYPVGILMWLLNIPLYIWGLKELGNKFAFRTFFAFTLNSFFIDLFTGNSWIPGLGLTPKCLFKIEATISDPAVVPLNLKMMPSPIPRKIQPNKTRKKKS